MKVGILVSHPIQYFSPWFRALAEHIDLHVFYANRPSAERQGEGFGEAFQWDVDLLSDYQHSFLVNRSADPGTHHFRGCDTPEIGRIIEEEKFDAFIVCGWFLKSYWQAVRACRRNKVPVLVRGDSQLDRNESFVKRILKRLIYPARLASFDGFLSVGKRNREYLLHYGVPEDRIFFVPHFVDNDWFAARAAEERTNRAQIRAKWGASDATFVLLFVGKLIPKKRPQDLLRAVAEIREQDSRFLIVFVGAGELQDELRSLANQLRLAVHFAGFQNQTQLPRFYCAADALVLPSNATETWGLVVNEAMACGLPAVVSDAVGCAPDLIDEDKTGFVFPTGETTELANRIGLIAALKSQRKLTGALAKKAIQYSLDRAIEKTLAALRKSTGPASK